MIRISQGIWPEEVSERNFFTPKGEYRVDKEATKTMRESLMYKMSYYRFNEAFGQNSNMDRVRQQVIEENVELHTLEEVFSSENWLVRVYKVKDLDNAGRDLTKVDPNSGLSSAVGSKKKRRVQGTSLRE